MKKYGKFGALVVVIVGTILWLATTGVGESKAYYKTIEEVGKMGGDVHTKRLRVAGDVEKGSIVRKVNIVEFTLEQEHRKLKVVYSGTDPLPDTFRDGAQALADGKMGADGVFHANKIQAKCASKYEAKPGQKSGEPQSYPKQVS